MEQFLPQDLPSLQLNSRLCRLVRDNLESFTVRRQQRKDKRRAAVCLTLVNIGSEKPIFTMASADPDAAALVLTRRSSRLKKHAGQWALPGGSIDPGETPEQTALRELEEEVGVRLPLESVLGQLDDFTTRSGFVITPVVVWGGKDIELQANYEEVDSIHRIPLYEFMRNDAPVLQSIPESDNPVLLMPVGQGWIASPTGAIIYQFREVAIKGKVTRVAHYEQPYFAWK